MSEVRSSKTDPRNDEIDLVDLFRRFWNFLGRGLKSIGKGILISVFFMLRHWLPLTLSMLVAIAASYYSKYTFKSYYTSDMVIRTNAIPAADMIAYINRLNLLNSNSEFNNKVGLDQQLEENLIDINAYWMIDQGNDGIADFVDFDDKHNVYDTVNVRMNDRINVRVRIRQPEQLNKTKDFILGYIYSDSLFQRMFRLARKQNNELLNHINYDILQLDSLQKVKYFEETRNRKPQNGGQMIFLQEQKTQLVYNDIYNLYTKKQKVEMESDLYKDLVTILSDFSIPAERDNNPLYYAKTFVPLFFLLTLLILIIIANRKKLNEVYKKY